MRGFKYVIVFFSLLVMSAQSFAAIVSKREEVAVDNKDQWVLTIYVDGEIDQNTPRQIAAALNDIRRNGHLTKGSSIGMSLNSGGGDLEAGFAIGILAREYEMNTFVRSVCASACAIAYLGGVSRFSSSGRYGIHRPYTNRYNESDADARRSYERINKLTAAYLARMNITPRLLEAMNIVPPGEIRWLTEAERNDLGIDGIDPVYSDRKISEYARRLGITKSELIQRQQHANSLCYDSSTSTSFDDKIRCYQDIVEGRRR